MSIQAGDVVWNITGHSKELNQALKDSERMAQESYGRIAQIAGAAMTAIGVATTAAFGLMANSAMTFGSQMAKVASLGVTDLAGMEKAAKAAAVAVGGELGDAAEGIYQALSAGIPEGNIYDFIHVAAIAAAGSQATLTEAVDLGTTIVNAFGTDAQKAFDQAAVAAMIGKTELDLMAGSIGQVAAVFANTAGGSDQLFASIAALTLQGVQTSESMTGIKAVLSSLATPSAIAREAAKELGVEYSLSAMRAQGFTQYLHGLYETAQKTGKEGLLPLLFPMEALNTALVLGGRGAGVAADALKMMNKEGSMSTEMFNRLVAADPGFAFRQLKTEVSILFVEIGQKLLPTLKDLVDWIRPIVQGIGDWTKAHPGLTGAILATSAALGGVALVVGPIMMMMPGLIATWGLLSAALTAVGITGGAAAVGVAATGAAAAAATAPIAAASAAAGTLAIGMGALTVAGPGTAVALAGGATAATALGIGLGAAAVSAGLLAAALLGVTVGVNYAAGKVGEYYSATEAAANANSNAIDGIRALTARMDELGIAYDHAKVSTLSAIDASVYLQGVLRAHREAVASTASTAAVATDLIGQSLQTQASSYYNLATTVDQVYAGMTWSIVSNATMATQAVAAAAMDAAEQVNIASQYAAAAESRRRPQGAGFDGFAAGGGYGYQPANGLDWWGGGDWGFQNPNAFIGMGGFSPEVMNLIQHGATPGGAPVSTANAAPMPMAMPSPIPMAMPHALPLPSMPASSPGFSGAGVGGDLNVTVNITGPVSLETRADIERVSRELGAGMEAEIRRRGLMR